MRRLLVIVLAMAVDISGSPCDKVILGSCSPYPGSVIHQMSNLTSTDCGVLCSLFVHCVVFQHTQESDTCTLFSADYRLQDCATVAGPAFRPEEENILAACQEALKDDPSSCNSFIEENCQMEGEPEGGTLPGETASPQDCANVCGIEGFSFFSFSLAVESTCECFISPASSCTDLGGPGQPFLESCTKQEVILLTGGAIESNGSLLPTSTTEVVGSYCEGSDLPFMWVFDEYGFQGYVGYIAALTPDSLPLVCGHVGFDSEDYFEGDVCYTLNPGSQKWIKHSVIIGVVFGSSAVTLEDGVYVTGFWQGDVNYVQLKYAHLPVGSTTWVTQYAEEVLDFGIGACTVAISPWNFLIIGGGGLGNQVWEYDSRNASWTQWPNLSIRRASHACAVVENDVIIAGGVSHDDMDDPDWNYNSDAMTTTTIININTREERSGGDMNSARVYFSLVMVDGKLVALWGTDGFDQSAAYQDNVQSLLHGLVETTETWDPITETWSLNEDWMGTPRAGYGHISGPPALFCP